MTHAMDSVVGVAICFDVSPANAGVRPQLDFLVWPV